MGFLFYTSVMSYPHHAFVSIVHALAPYILHRFARHHVVGVDRINRCTFGFILI